MVGLLAESAVSRSDAESSDLLDTLAAAYAETGDFETAIEEGATLVRVGSALFE